MSGNEGPGGQQGGQGGQQQPSLPWSSVGAGQTWNVGEGEAAKPWYDFMPEGPQRDLLAAKKMASPAILAQSYYELNRTASHINDANTLVIPGQGATQADWDAFYTKWGRPASASGYDGVNWGESPNEKMVGFAKGLAFKLGLNPTQAGTLASEWNAFAAQMNTEGEEASAAETAQTIQTIKDGWKGDFNADMAAGNRVLTALKNNGVTEEDIMAIERQVGIAPMVKMLATIGKLSGEAGFVSIPGQGGQMDASAMTDDQAAAEVKRLSGDKDFQEAYTKRDHPNHASAVERMSQLYAKAGNKIQL